MKDWPSRVKKVYDDLIAALDLDPEQTPILIGELATTEAGGDLGWRNSAIAEAADLIPNGHLISAAGCPALKEASYTLHFTRDGYETFGKRYAEKMLELLKAMEPTPDTSKKDSVMTPKDSIASDSTIRDSLVNDSLVKDSASAIRSLPVVRAMRSTEPQLYFDAKEQSLFIRTERKGKVVRYRVTGRNAK